MRLPDDIERYVRRTFAAADQAAALDLVANAVTHDGQAAAPRLMRCAVVASGGTLAGLRRQIDQLKLDYRDVIVEGEYVPSGADLVRVRNLTGPILDDT